MIEDSFIATLNFFMSIILISIRLITIGLFLKMGQELSESVISIITSLPAAQVVRGDIQRGMEFV